jgi:hypothetical protein
MKNEVRQYLAEIGRKGGAAARGKAKARTSEQARAAVMKRWEMQRAKAQGDNPKHTQKG